MSTERKIEHPLPYKRLIAALIAWGIPMQNIGVGGGYCRDTYFNRQPKDMDIVVAGVQWPDKIDDLEFECLLPGGWEVVNTYDNDDEYAAVDSDFDERLAKVIKLRYQKCTETFDIPLLEEYEVDILVASNKFETVQQHINMNDFNINQFHISAIGVLCDWEPTYIGLEPYGTLRQTRHTQVHPNRTRRFIEYARSVNWEVDL